MDKAQNYETELPENYVLVKHVDAKSSKKIMAAYTALSFVPLLVLAPMLVLLAQRCGYRFLDDLERVSGALLPVCLILVVYMVLHELTHGLTYKFFTGAKLRFGLTLTVAFCGVPEIYVRKKASFAALVMPFSVFSVLFLALTVGLWFLSPLYGVMLGIVFAIHLGGCVGDLHWALLYRTKFKNCNTLMRDTGPEQWLYVPREEAERYGIAQVAKENDHFTEKGA